jgi:hypothetical protein
VTVQGGLLRVKTRSLNTPFKHRTSVRQPIRSFTRKSRLNLLRLVSRLTDRPALFITLTYRQNIQDHVAAKRHLDLVLRWLKRCLPKSAVLWRMEYQARGAIHFHLIVLDAYAVPLQQFTAYWQKVTGDDSYPDVRFVQSGRRRLLAYVSKYIAKQHGLDNVTNSETWVGRFWGVFNRKHLPFAPEMTLSIIHAGVLYSLRRVVRRFLQERGSARLLRMLKVGRPYGFSVFIGSSERWAALVWQIAADWYAT